MKFVLNDFIRKSVLLLYVSIYYVYCFSFRKNDWIKHRTRARMSKFDYIKAKSLPRKAKEKNNNNENSSNAMPSFCPLFIIQFVRSHTHILQWVALLSLSLCVCALKWKLCTLFLTYRQHEQKKNKKKVFQFKKFALKSIKAKRRRRRWRWWRSSLRNNFSFLVNNFRLPMQTDTKDTRTHACKRKHAHGTHSRMLHT